MSRSVPFRHQADRIRTAALPGRADFVARLVRLLLAAAVTVAVLLPFAGVARLAHAASAGHAGPVPDVDATPCFGRVDLSDRVEARDTDTWNVCFERGGTARLRVRGDGDTDLDCFVYDASGREVARDDDYTDFCVLDWQPQSYGNHRLEIRNLGNVWNAYRLYTR